MAWVELIEGWTITEGESGSSGTRVFHERTDGTATLPVYHDVHPDNDSLVVTEITTRYIGSAETRTQKEIKYSTIPGGGVDGTPTAEGDDGGARRDARMASENFSWRVDPGASNPWYWKGGNPTDDALKADFEAHARIVHISESIPLIIRDYKTLRETALGCIQGVNDENNDEAFFNAQSETVLFQGYSANAFYNPEAKVRWDVRLQFVTRIVTRIAGEVAGPPKRSNDGWNYEIDKRTGTWNVRINDAGGYGHYERVAMAPLLALQ